LQILLELMRYRREHAANLGVRRLPAEERKKLDAAVLQMVKTKDTSALEGMLNGDKPQAPSEPTPVAAPAAPATPEAKP
jgi:hypothetical protein